MPRSVCLAVALVVGIGPGIEAQTLDAALQQPSIRLWSDSDVVSPLLQQANPRPPRRTSRRPQRGQSLLLTANLTGGHDDNVGATSGAGATVPALPTAGTSAFADAMLEYSRGSEARRITFRGLASYQAFPDYLDTPAIAAKFRTSGHARLGHSDVLRYSAQVRSEALFTPGVAEELDDPTAAIDLANASPPLASPPGATAVLFERRSLVSSNKAYLDHSWSPRDKMVVAYLFYAQRITSGGVGDNKYQQVAADYHRNVSSSLTFRTSFQRTAGKQTDSSLITRPNSQQTISGGPSFEHRLSGTKVLSASLNIGATYVENVLGASTEPTTGWMPTAGAASSIAFTKAWSAGAAYGRGFSMLQGLTGQFFATHQFSASTTGRLTSRIDVAGGATRGTGRVALGSQSSDSYEVYTMSLNARVRLASMLAATAGYTNYRQRYSNPSALPPGFPANYERGVFTVGVTAWMPLAGTLPARPRGPGEW